MTILQLKYFVEVANHGSFSLASKTLFVTQPALSSSIHHLEEEYQMKLFERKSKGLVLTKEGEFFYEKAKIILEGIDIFERDLKDLSHKQTTIRIGVPPMIGSFLFPQIYNKYALTHENAKFEIWEEGSLSIRSKIMNKTLDLGFSILNDSEQEHYEREVILETELLYCVSKKNPLSKKKSLVIDDIKDEPIMMMREGAFQFRLINSMFGDINVEPNIIFISSQISVLRNFVKMNVGGAFLIKELLDPDDDMIVGIPFKEPINLNIGLLWQKNIELHSGAQQFVRFIKGLVI